LISRLKTRVLAKSGFFMSDLLPVSGTDKVRCICIIPRQGKDEAGLVRYNRIDGLFVVEGEGTVFEGPPDIVVRKAKEFRTDYMRDPFCAVEFKRDKEIREESLC